MSANRKDDTRRLIECSLLIAMGTILAQIKLLHMPSGGSVTALSMLPFILISFRHGLRWGILSGLVNAVLQMALGGLYMPPAGTFSALAGSVLLDYVLAYMSLGAACALAPKGRGRVLIGTAAACFLRFSCAFLSGALIWRSLTDDLASALIYSLGYNAAYLVPESLLTCLAAQIVYVRRPDFFCRQ